MPGEVKGALIVERQVHKGVQVGDNRRQYAQFCEPDPRKRPEIYLALLQGVLIYCRDETRRVRVEKQALIHGYVHLILDIVSNVIQERLREGRGAMKITEVEAVRIDIPLPGEGFRPAWGPGLVQRAWSDVLVKIHTDEGITGYAAGHSFVQHIEERIAPYLVGKDPFALEYHHQVLLNAGGAFFIDIALWDIIGKACGQPLYKLFGGHRTKIKAYAATCEVGTPERRAEDALRYLEEGFTAMKLRLHNWTLKEDIALVTRVREAVGDRMEIMVDANQTFNIPSPGPWPKWTYQRAVDTARALEELDVDWLEEPLWRYNYEDLGRLAGSVDIPIAGGEFNMGLHEFRAILEHGAYDILQADPAYLGLTQTRKVLAMAEAYDKPYAPHNGYNGLGVTACLHLVLAHPQGMYLEYLHDPPVAPFEIFASLVAEPLKIDKEGYVQVSEKPGLGVELNNEIIAKYGKRA